MEQRFLTAPVSDFDPDVPPPDPWGLLEAWYQEWLQACSRGVLPEGGESAAMTLATATAAGVPSSRTVLLRELRDQTLVFFTNYQGRKARELLENPVAALLFYWPPLGRQIRVVGTVAKVSPEVSDAYFASRPRGSQLGAWASPQSEVLPNRQALEDAAEQIRVRFENQEVPRPSHWGGFAVTPTEFEFWQDGTYRLHDRLYYSREDGRWVGRRLAP